MEKLGVPSNQQQQQQQGSDRIDPNNDNHHLSQIPPVKQPATEEAEADDGGAAAVELDPSILGRSTTAGNVVTSQVNVVRVLFKDQQDKEQAIPHELTSIAAEQQQQQSLAGTPTATTTTTPINATITGCVSRPTNRVAPRLQATIVSANRRLIERQLEAIQDADSRRWNFDFRACRPLGMADHRYVHLLDSSNLNHSTNRNNNDNNNNNNNNNADINCRPLSDQNSNIASRLINNNQQRWSARATRGNHPDRSDHNKPEED